MGDNKFKTPWTCEKKTGIPFNDEYELRNADDKIIFLEDDVVYAASCVNACAGIENPEGFINDARSYSYQTVKGLVDHRDAEIARLKEEIADLIKAVGACDIICKATVDGLQDENAALCEALKRHRTEKAKHDFVSSLAKLK